MTSDFQRRGPISGRPGVLPSLLCFPRVGPEFGSHSFGQSCGVPPLIGLVLEGLAWSTPSPTPCPQGTRLAALTPFPPSCTGVLHWSSPAGRASRGHLRARGAAMCAREGPASILAPLLLPHSASWTAPPDQDTPCRLALSGTSCPSSSVGAHFRETDSKATAFPPRCRPGCLLHRHPLPHGVSLVPQGLAPGPCAPVPRPASCSTHTVFLILCVTGWCTTK